MSKYRKKPVVIDAWQWNFSERQEPDPTWIRDALNHWPDVGGISFEPEHTDGPRICIATLEGVMVATPGDYIIRGVKGEIYACKSDIFEMTYDRVDDTAKPTPGTHDREVEEFNRGFDDYGRGVPYAEEPHDITEDQWRVGWAWAAFEPLRTSKAILEGENKGLRGRVDDLEENLREFVAEHDSDACSPNGDVSTCGCGPCRRAAMLLNSAQMPQDKED